MSLLSLPHSPRHFPSTLSSPPSLLLHLQRPPRPQHGAGVNPPAYPLAGGSLADWPTRLHTGCEPNLADSFSYMDTVNTPIHFSESHQNFMCSDDATMVPACTRGLPHSGASRSSQQTTASRVPSLLGPTSLGKPSCRRYHVPSRPSLQETEAELGRESVATTIYSSVKRKRERDSRVMHSLKG